jgi:uncharacterized protein (DUF2062 family)
MTSPQASNFAVTAPITAPVLEDQSGHPVRRFFEIRVTTPIVDLLRVGTTPRRLAWSLAIGVAIGINPVIGSTTFLCLLVAFLLRLNLIASQIANHLVFPLQLTLVVLYLKAGERLFHTGPPPIDAKELMHAMRRHPWSTTQTLWTWEWHAIIVWLIGAAVLTPVIATILCPMLTRLLAKIRREPAPQV